jgi:hypothetical protein
MKTWGLTTIPRRLYPFFKSKKILVFRTGYPIRKELSAKESCGFIPLVNAFAAGMSIGQMG